MNQKRILKDIWISLLLLLLFITTAGAQSLILPSDLTTIQSQAFLGNTGLYEIVLPSGIKTIENQAFANSSVKIINLPSALTSIADDAFQGVTNLTVNAAKNTYAYNWAVANGYINPVVSVGNNSITIMAGHESIYKFSAPSAGSYTFETTGSNDTCGVLYNSSKSVITSNDDGGDNRNFKIEYALSSGQTVYIGVNYYSASNSGTENLYISKSAIPTATKTPTPTPTKTPTPTPTKTPTPQAASFVISRPDGTVLYDLSNGKSSFNATLGAAASANDIYTMNITSNIDWSVSTSSDWFYVTQAGSQAILVVNENSRARSMNGTATFTVNGKSVTMKVTKPEWEAGLEFKLYHKNGDGAVDHNIYYTHDATQEYNNGIIMGRTAGPGDYYTFYVESNFYWENYENSNWFYVDTEEGDEDTTTRVRIYLNDNVTTDRFTGTLYFYCGDNEQEIAIRVEKPSAQTKPTLALEATSSTSFYNNSEKTVWFNAAFFQATLLTEELYNPSGSRVAFRNQNYVNNNKPAAYQITYDMSASDTYLEGMNAIFPSGSAAGTWQIKITASNSAGSVSETIDVIVTSEPDPVIISPSMELTQKFTYLQSKLPAGWKWIYDESHPVRIQYNGTELRTYISQKYHSGHVNGYNADDLRFWFSGSVPNCDSRQNVGKKGSTQCFGYAKMIGWALSGQDLTQSLWTYANDSNRDTLVSQLAPGDLVRGGPDIDSSTTGHHSMIVVRTDNNYIYVTDANSDGLCGIKWERQLSRSKFRVINGEYGQYYLRYVIKYDSERGIYYK